MLTAHRPMLPILDPVYTCEAGVPVHSAMMQDLAKTNEQASTAPDGALTGDKTRHLLFVSHANPEDNAAASWFATQLTLLGYDVWCDLRNTHAGESDVWLKVQNTIEHDAAKFIFILSNSSRDFSKKKGIYKEVQAADNLRRENFILPLRVEPLTGSVPIIIGPDLNINSENWADGLRVRGANPGMKRRDSGFEVRFGQDLRWPAERALGQRSVAGARGRGARGHFRHLGCPGGHRGSSRMRCRGGHRSSCG